jgi:membrane protease YdiL (CAAX protease family)
MAAPPDLAHSVQTSLTTASVFIAIAAIYALVVRYVGKVAWREIPQRIGLTVGAPRFYGYAAVALLCSLPLIHLMQHATAGENTSSPYLAFRGRGFSVLVVMAVFAYGMVSAGFGEELLFRGLIAGAFDRRMVKWKANVAQAIVFLLPHLLILLVAPGQWWSLIPFVSAFGLVLGWLRLSSGSIWPAVLVHGGGNTVLGLLYAGGVY